MMRMATMLLLLEAFTAFVVLLPTSAASVNGEVVLMAQGNSSSDVHHLSAAAAVVVTSSSAPPRRGDKKATKKKMKNNNKSSSVTVPISLCGDTYVGEVSFGSRKAEKFRMTFDSSLDKLVVFDKNMTDSKSFLSSPQGECAATRAFFNVNKYAKTAYYYQPSKNGETLFKQEFRDGSALTGTWLAYESIRLGKHYRTSTLEFLLASDISSGGNAGAQSFALESVQNTDAVMGLGFSRGAKQGPVPLVLPPVMRMLQQHTSVWTHPCVAFYISPYDELSHVSFGRFPDWELVEDGTELVHHFLSGHQNGKRENKWELDLRNLKYDDDDDDDDDDVNIETVVVASVDTARPVVSLPTAIFNAIIRDTHAEVFSDDGDKKKTKTTTTKKGKNILHYAECQKVDALVASLRFDIGLDSNIVSYSLDAFDLAKEEQPPGGPIEEKMCRLLIEDSGKQGRVELGHPFLLKYYTTFTYLEPDNNFGGSEDEESAEGSISTVVIENKRKHHGEGTEKELMPMVGLGKSKVYAEWKDEFRRMGREQAAAKNWGRDDNEFDTTGERGGRRRGKNKRKVKETKQRFEDEKWPKRFKKSEEEE